MGFQNRAGARTVNDARNTFFNVQANVCVKGGAHGWNRFTKNFASMFLNGLHQGRIACQRLHGMGHEKAFDFNADQGIRWPALVKGFDGVCNDLSNIGFYLLRNFLRNHAAI